VKKIMAELIDAHHHVWHYSPEDFGWINDEMELLRQDFLPGDLIHELAAVGLDGSVAVQARQSVEETRWLLACAGQNPEIRGVVGWLPLAEASLGGTLIEFRDASLLKGVRHVVQNEPDPNFLLGRVFNAGIDSLLDTGLVYDVLIFADHLPVASRFVAQHPQQSFVLDHMAKPNLRLHKFQPWANDLARFAENANVCCKLSGIVTEAHWTRWTAEELQPYLDHALRVFGPERLLAGSDWPVCLVASGYQRWWSTLMEWARSLPDEAREAILGGNAIRVYRLSTQAAAQCEPLDSSLLDVRQP
jgi:L-fuconolactonase